MINRKTLRVLDRPFDKGVSPIWERTLLYRNVYGKVYSVGVFTKDLTRNDWLAMLQGPCRPCVTLAILAYYQHGNKPMTPNEVAKAIRLGFDPYDTQRVNPYLLGARLPYRFRVVAQTKRRWPNTPHQVIKIVDQDVLAASFGSDVPIVRPGTRTSRKLPRNVEDGIDRGVFSVDLTNADWLYILRRRLSGNALVILHAFYVCANRPMTAIDLMRATGVELTGDMITGVNISLSRQQIPYQIRRRSSYKRRHWEDNAYQVVRIIK